MRRVQLVRGEGRGVSDWYGVRDAACPLSTRGGGPEPAPEPAPEPEAGPGPGPGPSSFLAKTLSSWSAGTLLNRMIHYLGRPPFVLHRLDMWTSGVVRPHPPRPPPAPPHCPVSPQCAWKRAAGAGASAPCAGAAGPSRGRPTGNTRVFPIGRGSPPHLVQIGRASLPCPFPLTSPVDASDVTGTWRQSLYKHPPPY